jgi:CBS domain-containing protein
VSTVAPSDPLRKAAHLMLQYEVSGLPVVDRGKLVGIISEADFLRRIETGTERHRPRWIEMMFSQRQLAEETARAQGSTVGEVMSRNVVTIREDAQLEEAVSLMERHGIKRLPVIEGEALIGILTRANLVHAFIIASAEQDRSSRRRAASV